ncbi:MAG TPA: sugar phosphate isomerase/epimerase [Planctomycetes bacterium]|nr:sugar phosphate isomerase/epimerase [Planctomycetaceae bacterium]HIM29957.1 sugar phosphate isomerase/epimerase [Planctomycetota bacterium]
MAMKLAICNETFKDWPFDKAFAYARQAGYTGIEIAPFTMNKDAYQITPAMRSDTRDLAAEHELEVVGLHWLLAFTEGYYLTSPDKDVQRRTGEYLAELARLCRDLTGKVLVLGSPFQRNLLEGVSHDEAMEYAMTTIRVAIDTFEQCEVVLALEPLGPQEGDFLLTADAGRELLEMIDSPACKLHLDVKAMSTESTSIEQIIRKHADVMVHFHANDANRRGPGMGDIEFEPIIRTLRDVNYEGWISVEIFDYDPGVETLVDESINCLNRCLAATT